MLWIWSGSKWFLYYCFTLCKMLQASAPPPPLHCIDNRHTLTDFIDFVSFALLSIFTWCARIIYSIHGKNILRKDQFRFPSHFCVSFFIEKPTCTRIFWNIFFHLLAWKCNAHKIDKVNTKKKWTANNNKLNCYAFVAKQKTTIHWFNIIYLFKYILWIHWVSKNWIQINKRKINRIVKSKVHNKYQNVYQ